MTPSIDELLAALDPMSSPELQLRVITALESPASELAKAVKGVERWAREQLNPLAPSPDVGAIPLPREPDTLRISFEQRAAALLGKRTGRRGHAELARLLLDEMGAASSEADHGRMLQALDDPDSELSQLVRGFEQWAHSLKRT